MFGFAWDIETLNPPKSKITAFFIIKEFGKKKTLFIKEKLGEIKIKIKSFWEIGAWFLVLLESPP
jgi:hypothetical protein